MTCGRSMPTCSDRRRGALLRLAGVLLLAAAPAAHAEQFECLVEPYASVSLSSGVPGILDQVPVDRGDTVEKDQVVATLKSDVERAHLDLVRAKLDFAERKARRNEEMYRKQMISIHEKDELETEAHVMKLELAESEARLGLRTIRSPIAGVVVERHFSPGEFVQDRPILDLAQIDPLRVEVSVPVRYHGRIEVGMQGTVQWESPIGVRRTATVTVVDPVVDAASGTIGVRLEVPNPDHRLPAGTKCSVRFPVSGP